MASTPARAGISRRVFLGSSAAGVFALGDFSWPRQGDRADLIIRNGVIYAGTGAAGVDGDVAIAGGRITEIGRRLAARGVEEIDVRGQAIAPGFIDIHSHADSSLSEDPRAESVIRQGVTTIVGGQDGSSRSPRAGDAGHAPVIVSIDGALPAVNVAWMIGLGTVRGMVVGNADRPATAEELQRMTGLVDRALGDGACGASSGLEYTPGAFATIDELAAVCKPLASRKLPYATHMRNEDDRLLEAIDESIAVARGAGCPLQISHLKTQGPRNWRKLDEVFARVARARASGIDVTFDRYPYIAYQTGLTNLFPIWSREGGTENFFSRLDDAAASTRIRTETLAKVDLIGGWDNVMITSVRAEEDRQAEGKRLGSHAASLAIDPYAYTVGLLRRSRGSVGMVGFAMSEENLDRILAHPQAMICSDGGGFAVDGPTRRGNPHPRGLGSFPRVLGRYVRERKALSLAAAIQKMTGLPASRLRLADRGHLAAGKAADVVVFDPARVADRATYESPFQYPDGISVVIVNGAIALRDGERSKAGNGRALRPA
jgi:N-acyl-D-amino-acid deacylase